MFPKVVTNQHSWLLVSLFFWGLNTRVSHSKLILELVYLDSK
jgi:hypothetical protein